MFNRLAFAFACSSLLFISGCISVSDGSQASDETLAASKTRASPAADLEALQSAENQMQVGQTTRLALPAVRTGGGRFWTLARQDSGLVEHIDSALVTREDTLFRYDVFKAIGIGRAHIHYAWRDTLMADSLLQEDTTASFYIQIVNGRASL
ncbi:MAG: hypothetical protein ACOCZ8_00045 [Bacteroidota bacterium]